MSTNHKSRKPFVVRGIDVNTTVPFDCIGRMSDNPNFSEITVDRQHDAVAEMLTHSKIGTMAARRLITRFDAAPTLGSGPLPTADDVKEVYVIDLSIVTVAQSVSDLRPFRSNIRDVLKTWAEKSRVKGRRGWRANAVKTPSFEFDKAAGSVVIRTQVVLSTAIFYSNDLSTINFTFDRTMEVEDLNSLHRELSRFSQTGGFYGRLKYRHSVIGDGEVI